MANDDQRKLEEKIARAAREAARSAPRAPIAVDDPSEAPEAEPEDAARAAVVAPEAEPEATTRAAAAAPREPVAATASAGREPPPGAAPSVLRVEHVSQRYPKPGGFQLVLNDVSVHLPAHDFVSVVGPSGCGKSTLLRLVLGSESPWQGTVHADGKLIDHPDRNRGIVFQRYSLFPHLTVLQNVLFGLELDGTWLLQKWLTWPWYRATHHRRYVEQAMTHLRTVKLDEHAHKYPQQLSGGMQQRVAIAQALIMKPRILLMDEPFGALDPGTREALQLTIVEAFREHQMSVFFVTHDLEEALFVGNRLLVLSQFWRFDDDRPGEGAKLVMDVTCPKSTSVDVKGTPEFQELLAEVRHRGFDPEVRQRLSELPVPTA